ncbi:PucR family transcriptional regulator [Streptosporangium sp. NBC_01756]|uniref:PucR family transcriptional regulator n=1 Tax=Streptosporangium sp. NBC_01756 TaxID=2975950 RepID=UPI002DD84507|nr:helix-turn-helix domain-containing protein [Streptosporangium sp. NBC_01756]WSC87870.1 helix-turn-helix domain-containing protein [Streptosporangium sp. NBC_01756]
MRGLLNRLSSIDSSAERGLQVIEFFDQLLSHRADAEAVARATAILSQTTAGVIFDEIGEVHVVDPAGRTLDTSGPGLNVLISDIIVDNDPVGRVWLERRDEADGHEWDELITARFALTMAALYSRSYSDDTHVGLTNPELLHTLLSDQAGEAETARAARLLGFGVGQPVRVLAVHAEARIERILPAFRAAVAGATTGRTVAAPMTNDLAVLIAAGAAPRTPTPHGIAVCVGPEVAIEQCGRSWSQARRGIRFAALRANPSNWILAEDLGCVIALADLDPQEIMSLPDVCAVGELANSRSGSTDMKILDQLGWQGSLREVATALHMHHSSVAYRVDRISDLLGFDVRSSDGRYRGRTALLLWHLHAAPRMAQPDTR